jgi:hypothetical protein
MFLSILFAFRLSSFISATIAVSNIIYRVLHFKVSISAPRLELGSKSQQILTLARARSICGFQPLGAKARTMPVDFFDALDVKPVR